MSRYAIRLTPKQCMDLYEDDLAKTEKLVEQLQAKNKNLEDSVQRWHSEFVKAASEIRQLKGGE